MQMCRTSLQLHDTHFSIHTISTFTDLFTPHSPQAGGVQCTCTGFHVPNLVKLWQSFRTYSLSTSVTILPQITCSTCGHTLQDHQPHPPQATPPTTGVVPERGERDREGEREKLLEEMSGVCNPQLMLKASTRLPLAPFKNRVQVLSDVEGGGGGRVSVVGLHSPTEGVVYVVVNSIELAAEGTQLTSHEEGEEIGIDLAQRATTSCVTQVNGGSGGEQLKTLEAGSSKERFESKKAVLHKQPSEAKKVVQPSESKGMVEPSESKKVVQPSESKGMVEPSDKKSVEPSESKKTVHLKQPSESKKTVRGRKRRRGGNHPATRKSARLQKKARREDGEEEEGRRRREEEMERVRGEQRALCGHVVQFVSSVEDKTSFTHHPLPQVILPYIMYCTCECIE